MDEVRQRLMTLAGAFALGTIVIVAVLSFVDVNEPGNPELADGSMLAAAIFGVIGLLLALRWWSTTGEIPSEPGRFQIGFIVRIAIAEVGLLIGILGYLMTGEILAPIIGGALFLAALVVMTISLKRIAG